MLTLLRGGPFDGCVVESSGDVPVLMLMRPRLLTLLDVIESEAVWCVETEWYARADAAPAD